MSLIELLKYLMSLDSAPLLLITLLLFIIYYKKVIEPDIKNISEHINNIDDDINVIKRNFLTRDDMTDLINFINNLSTKLEILDEIKDALNTIKNDLKECLQILDAITVGLVDTIKTMINTELSKITATISKLGDYEKIINDILENQNDISGDVKKSNTILIELSAEILKIEDDVDGILSILDTLINLVQTENLKAKDDNDRYDLSLLMKELSESRNHIYTKYDYLRNNIRKLFPESRIKKYVNSSQTSPRENLEKFINDTKSTEEK